MENLFCPIFVQVWSYIFVSDFVKNLGLNEDISWIQCKKEDKDWICRGQKMDFEDKRWPNTGQGQNVDHYWTYSGHMLDMSHNVDKMWDTDISYQHLNVYVFVAIS